MMYTISAIGQDSHRFTDEDKPLVLGGVQFENERGLLANSDGDVVLHALTNAISGLTGVNVLGKIADELCNSGITDSAAYLRVALNSLKERNMKLLHISMSIECKTPKITPKIDIMKKQISLLCGIETDSIGITATTGEGLTEFGKGNGIQVFCIATAQKE